MFPGQRPGLKRLGFRNIPGVCAGYTLAFLMHIKHDLFGSAAGVMKNSLQDIDDKVHSRIVVVLEQHIIGFWFPNVDVVLGNDVPLKFTI